MKTLLVLASCVLLCQWARAQCTASITTTPPSPLLLGQDITLAAQTGGSTGQVQLDGAVVCSGLPCNVDLGSNVAEGIHTLGWTCIDSKNGNNSGSQQLVVGRALQQFNPAFFIWSLLYAPPGNVSSNGYTTASSTGASSGVTQSFQRGPNSISFAVDFAPKVVLNPDKDPTKSQTLFTLSGGGAVAGSTTDANSSNFTETITNAAGSTLASTQDPLSHYQDRFFLWLNPQVTVFQTGDQDGVFILALPQDANGNPLQPVLTDVSVAELMNPSQIPLGTLAPHTDPITGATIPGLSSICANQTACTLTNACGCVASDFTTILQQDPLVFDPNNPNTDPSAQPSAVDATRYILNTVLSPEALKGPDCAPPTCDTGRNTFQITDATQLTTAVTNTRSYSVSETEGISLPIPFTPFTLRLATQHQWQWSDAVTQGNSHGGSTQASVIFQTSTIQCGDGNSGEYNIYEDARYHTFAFAPDPSFPLASCLTPQPDFNLVAFPPANAPPTVLNGSSGTYLVSSVDYLGFTGTEQLSVTGATPTGSQAPLPAGVSFSFTPPSFSLSPSATGTSILTVTTTNGTTPAGNTPLLVVGTAGSITHTAPIAINISDFKFTVTSNSSNVLANGTMTYTVSVQPLAGFNNSVVLTLGPLPVGISGSFNPPSIDTSGTSTLTITTSGATPGNTTFNVTGTAGVDSQTLSVPLSVVDFGISTSPSSQTLAQGGSITYNVSTTALNNFGDPINLTVTGLPNGVSSSFSTNPITGAGTSTLTLTASSTAQLGQAPFTVNGTSRGVTHAANVTVQVNPPPVINNLAPPQAPVGTFVVANGSNFNASQGSNTLTVNGAPVTPSSWSDSGVAFSVPTNLTPGNVPVFITVNGVQSNIVNLGVTAGITGISPASGPVGTSIAISGTDFGTSQGSSTVTIGGLPASVTGWSNGSLSASVPLNLPLGNAPVVVTVNGLASNSANFAVTPGITGLAPTSGPVGTAVTITGTNFGTGGSGSTVSFAGTNATPTSWNPNNNNTIVVPVPGLAVGAVNVVVTVNGAASNAFSFTYTPGIGSLSATSGPVGTVVTITGSDFGTTQGTSSVTIGGATANVTTWSATSIQTSIPSSLGVGTAPVIVTVGGVPSNSVNFTVTPGITGFTPPVGPVGTSVTINGSNFGNTQGNSTVSFAGITTVPSNWSPSAIVAPVPIGVPAGNAAVVVTVGGTPSPSANFSVSPAITGVSPVSGPVGTSLTISGTSFGPTQKTSTVTVGGLTVSPTSWSDSTVKAPVPASLGLVAAPVVINVAGLPSNSTSFQVTPGITSVAPSSGPVGTLATITGSNFGTTQGNSTVTVGGQTVTPGSWSNNSIGITVPAGLGLGPASVVVTVSGLSSNAPNFTLTPGISNLSPASGPVGTSVTITGSNFGATQGTSALTFAGSAITPSSWSAGSIAFSVPNVSPGAASIGVTVNGLNSNIAAFTVTPVITNLSLIAGPAGSAVTITGTNFGSSQGSSSVTFAGIAAAVTSWSSGSIGVTVPPGLGSGSSPVIVTVNGAASNTSFFTATPNIASLSPPSSTTGATVTISGSAFGAAQGSSTVTFNGVAANATSWGNGTILATVPANATSGNVVVTVNNIPSNGASFTVYSPSVYFQSAAASSTPGLFQLQTTTPTSPTNIVSTDLINQPPGEYLIQAFDTQAGVPNSSAVWQAGLNGVFTVYMSQIAGTTGSLFPDVKLFLNSATGTPICRAVSSTALTTTQTLYTLSCAPSANVALSPSDRFYLWVGVSSSVTSSVSETAQLTVGPPSRGRQGGTVKVPVR